MRDSVRPASLMFADYQNEIYQRGAQGQLPKWPIRVEDLELAARKVLTPEAYNYIAGGAGGETTMSRNRQAFDRWEIVPRMLRDVSSRQCGVRLLGQDLPVPVLLAPIGVQSIAHEDGECAVGRAAAQLGLPYIHSTAATASPEEVSEEMGEGARWFQLYWPKDPELAASFVSRAENAGYSALVVTLDTRQLAWRERDLTAAYLPFLRGEGMGIYLSDPVFRKRLGKDPRTDMPSAISLWAENFSDLSHTWENLTSLKNGTRLPLILKGILHPDDARRAVDYGADGIIVSNHGGRQMDGAIGALDALPSVVSAVAGAVPVLFDSGIRRGCDVFKALALGASAVLVGRPYMWGLALGGQEGVVEVMRRLMADFDLTLSLAGCADVQAVGRDCLRQNFKD